MASRPVDAGVGISDMDRIGRPSRSANSVNGRFHSAREIRDLSAHELGKTHDALLAGADSARCPAGGDGFIDARVLGELHPAQAKPVEGQPELVGKLFDLR